MGGGGGEIGRVGAKGIQRGRGRRSSRNREREGRIESSNE